MVVLLVYIAVAVCIGAIAVFLVVARRRKSFKSFIYPSVAVTTASYPRTGTLSYVWRKGLVKPRYYGLTAAHVVVQEGVKVIINDKIVGTVVKVDKHNDLAAIEFDGEVNTDECNGFAFPFETSQEYPISSWPVMRSCNGDARVRIDSTYRWILSGATMDWLLVARVWATRTVLHHDSGSGVYDSKNRLLGMVTNAHSLDAPGSCWAYMVGSPTIKEFIKTV